MVRYLVGVAKSWLSRTRNSIRRRWTVLHLAQYPKSIHWRLPGPQFRENALRASVERAMSGHTLRSLRAVSAEPDHGAAVIRLRFAFDGEPDGDAREDASCVGAEVITDFVDGWMIDTQIGVCPVPSSFEQLRLHIYGREV